MEAMNDAAQKGKLDDETFKKGVVEYRERIFLLILRYIRNREDAHDLTQDTFLKAYRSRHLFRGDSSLYTWLYRIAINLAINYKTRSRELSNLSLDDAPEPASPTETSDGLLNQELKDMVEKAIVRLPNRQRMVFILHYYEARPHLEIAEMLGITEGAVKANYHQAIHKLQKELSQYVRGGV